MAKAKAEMKHVGLKIPRREGQKHNMWAHLHLDVPGS